MPARDASEKYPRLATDSSGKKKGKRKRKRRDAGRRRRKEKVEEENEGGEEESRKGEKGTDARSVRGRICAARVYVTTLHQRRHSPDPYE